MLFLALFCIHRCTPVVPPCRPCDALAQNGIDIFAAGQKRLGIASYPGSLIGQDPT